MDTPDSEHHAPTPGLELVKGVLQSFSMFVDDCRSVSSISTRCLSFVSSIQLSTERRAAFHRLQQS